MKRSNCQNGVLGLRVGKIIHTKKNKKILLQRLKHFLCGRFSFCCCLKKCFCRCLPFCWFCSFLGHRCPESETTKSTKRETAVKTFLQCRQKIVATLFTKTNHTKKSKSLNLWLLTVVGNIKLIAVLGPNQASLG